MDPVKENTGKILYPDLSYKIVGLAMEIHRKLGPGFLEKVYENALMVLLRRQSIRVVQQASIDVHFEGELVGHYVADILVEDKIIVEIKAVADLTSANKAQALNYLKATNHRLALLINFGRESLQFERIAR